MNKDLKKYLEKNYSVIYSKNKSKKDLSIIDSDLGNKEIFLIGENHGVKANVELKMKFLKYFKEKTNFKYYLCELPYSMTYFLNIYLETGNENILKDIYQPLKGTDAWNRDEYKFWKNLYEFNKSLSENNKIIAIGIDIEHQLKNAFKFLKYCLNKNNISEIINNYVKEFNNKNNKIRDEELKNLNKNIKEELCKKESLYKSLFGEDYYKFKHVNNNLLNMLEVYSSNNFNGVRDEKMYNNFLSIFNYLPKDKYFGQIGLSHIFQKSFPYVTWFGAFLNKEDSQFKGKILSVAYAYKNCKYLYPTIRKNYVSTIDTLDSSIVEFEFFINNKNTIFKLSEEESPFTKKLIWPLKHKNPVSGVTTDYFQYLVIIKNSDEMKEFNKETE